LAFAQALLEVGHEVTFVTVDKIDWDLLRRVFGEDLSFRVDERFLFVKMPRMLNALSRGFFTVLFYLFIVFWVKFMGGFDLTVGTSGELIDSVSDVVYVNALPLRLMHLYPDVYVERGVYWRCYSRLYDLFLKVIGRITASGLLLTNSRFNRELIRRYLGRDALVLYPPVDVGRFEALAEKLDRENLVVTVSRFRPGKVLENVPKIAKLVKGPGSEGSQETVKELRRVIDSLGVEDRVELLVGEPSSRLPEVLSSAKVFLHTQPYEAFGIAVVESMAAGCIPVVPRVGGPWMDILDRRQGLYGYSYGGLREAAEEIEMLIRDDVLRRKISVKAVKRARCFDASVFKRKLISVIERLL